MERETETQRDRNTERKSEREKERQRERHFVDFKVYLIKNLCLNDQSKNFSFENLNLNFVH
jgi:hypothetical protein